MNSGPLLTVAHFRSRSPVVLEADKQPDIPPVDGFTVSSVNLHDSISAGILDWWTEE